MLMIWGGMDKDVRNFDKKFHFTHFEGKKDGDLLRALNVLIKGKVARLVIFTKFASHESTKVLTETCRKNSIPVECVLSLRQFKNVKSIT